MKLVESDLITVTHAEKVARKINQVNPEINDKILQDFLDKLKGAIGTSVLFLSPLLLVYAFIFLLAFIDVLFEQHSKLYKRFLTLNINGKPPPKLE